VIVKVPVLPPPPPTLRGAMNGASGYVLYCGDGRDAAPRPNSLEPLTRNSYAHHGDSPCSMTISLLGTASIRLLLGFSASLAVASGQISCNILQKGTQLQLMHSRVSE